MANKVAIVASLVAGWAAVGAAPAYAAFDSVYTDTDLDQCMIMSAHEMGASFACPGYKGYPLMIAEDDVRFFVSYGFGAPDEIAAHQTIPPFNYIGKKLEWRLSDQSGQWRPVATILRWIEDPGDGSKGDQFLVVTKIEPGNTCHVAYIDAGITANANEIARQFADSIVADFNCANDEPIHYPD